MNTASPWPIGRGVFDWIEVDVKYQKMHVSQLRLPTLEITRKLAVVLSVSADVLILNKDERGQDEELRLQFEAVSRFDAQGKKAVKALLEGLILKHEAKCWLQPWQP